MVVVVSLVTPSSGSGRQRMSRAGLWQQQLAENVTFLVRLAIV